MTRPEALAASKMRTQPANFTLSGDGMCIGWDSGDAVSDLYKAPGRFKGYEDLALEAKRHLMKR